MRLAIDQEGARVQIAEPTEPSASERAYAWTRSKVLDGSLAGGTMISENDVSKSLGISRTPVREAFLRLSGEGVLQLFPKRGALIVPITAGDVRDVIEARLLIEPWAVSVVASGPSLASIMTNLRTHVSALRRAAANKEILAYQEADRAFHETIVSASGNQLLATFYRSLRDRQIRMGAAALIDSEDRVASIVFEHQQITDAIGAGDSKSAQQLVQAHIERTRAVLDTRGHLSEKDRA